MNKEQLEALAREAAKTIKIKSDLNDFLKMLTKVTIETALNVELDDHLGSERNKKSQTSNNRNGFTSKTLKSEDGCFVVDTPRDRDNCFEPKLVLKHQTWLTRY